MAISNPLQFIQQVRSEVSKVVWPTRREVLLTTVMVFVMAALAAVIFARFQKSVWRAAIRVARRFFWILRTLKKDLTF